MLNKKQNKNNDGFSLIEVLVVVAIFVILASVTMFNYRDFDNNIILTNMAYEVALTIREAQVFSLGVRDDDGSFDSSYGVYLNPAGTMIKQQSFLFFSDEGGSGRDFICNDADGDECNVTQCTLGSECEKVHTLTKNVSFDKICLSNIAHPIDAEGQCSEADSKNVTITFQRPYPEAHIYDVDSGLTPYKRAAILLTSDNGAQRAIIVDSNGQIYVEFINN